MQTLELDGESLTIDNVVAVARAKPGALTLRLTPGARHKVLRAREAVERIVARGDVVYGITTGFGAFKDKVIPLEQVRQLQRNIVMSHAVGVGKPFSTDVVRAMMLVRANTLAKGHSGIRLETMETLLAMLERGVHPIVPEQGRWGPVVIWPRWPTWRWCSSARERRRSKGCGSQGGRRCGELGWSPSRWKPRRGWR